MANGSDAPAQPVCIHQVLARIEAGQAGKADAEFLRAVLRNASTTIDRLQLRVRALVERLNTTRLH